MLCGGSCATAKALRAAAAQGTDAGGLCLPGRLSAGSSPGTEEHRILGLCREVPWSPPVVALAVTGAQDGQRGVPEVQGPPSSNGSAAQSFWLPGILGQGESSRLQGKEGLGERTSEGNAHRKSQLCVKRNKGSPQSALLSQWALSATQESPPVWPTPFHQCFTVHGPAPAGAATGTDRPCLSCASGRSCLSAPWLLWAGELRGKPGAPVP